MAERPKRRKRWIAAATGGALLAGGAVVGIGPLAPWVADNFVDGVHVGRFGQLKLQGVSGGWLGDLRAQQITVEDDHGVWFEANDVSLRWHPLDILFGGVNVTEARASSLTVSRQPNLLPPTPPGHAKYDIHIGALHAEAIHIAEPVLGQDARFTGDVALDLRDDTLRNLNANIRRTDSDADHLIAIYNPTSTAYTLNVDVLGEAGGILSRVLGVEDKAVRAEARGSGDAHAGSTTYSATIGADQLLSGGSQWSAANWSADAHIQLDLLPALQSLVQRIGRNVDARVFSAAANRFTLHAQTPFLAVDASGALNDHHELDGPAHFVATTQRLSDIARESPFELGEARLEGDFRNARGTMAIQGTLDGREINALGQHARLAGPVRAALTEAAFRLNGDLRATGENGPLFANARLTTQLAYDRHRNRFSLDRSELTGDAIAINAQGWANGGGEFAGDWRLRRLQAVAPDMRGEVGGRWRAFAEQQGDAHIWTITANGLGANVSGAPDIIPQLTGRTPRLDGRFKIENGGITVVQTRIDGERLRAGASGRIVHGEANLGIEASARGPLRIGGAEIAGAADATGRLTGPLARPTLSARANLSSFAAGGVVVANPVVDFTLAPGGRAYVGHATVNGRALEQPLVASADLSIADSAIALSGVDARLAALQAHGAANINAHGLSANLALAGGFDGLAPGAAGRLTGSVSFTPERLMLDAQIADAHVGELHMRAATLHAEGPTNSIATRFNLTGRLSSAPLTFAGIGTLDLHGEPALSIEGRGQLAGVDVFTRAPMHGQWHGGDLEASLDVALGDGVLQAQWRERGRAVTGSAQVQNAPIAPIAAVWGERASGTADGHLTLANSGNGLSGNADLTMNDARFAGRQRGALDMHVVANLDPSRLRTTLDANSSDGLVAHLQADAPVATSADPLRIALAPERRGQATWTVHGPASSLWAAARLQDQSLDGQLDGEGTLSFGAGYLSGNGHIEIADGRFEDKLSGITLTSLNARLNIDQNGVNIGRFTASDGHGGQITATGGSANQTDGHIAVHVENMRVADRPNARATASGELTLAWQGLQSNLTGELRIAQASLDIASNPEAGIPTLQVIEVNRPGYDDGETDDDPSVPIPTPRSTNLDIRITAPGRVFTRGRGVDAEWSLDMRLQGTSANPRITGQAQIVRGTLALSGQPFEIDDARIIFDGDPLDARIDLTATRDTADLTAHIRLTGTARDPEVTFSSDPPLPEDEILPQILFGRSVEDLNAFEAAQLAASLAALSGRASLDIMDAARAAAGLDRFNVQQDAAGGFLVAGGVYLTRDVYVEVARTGLGQAQTRVEWTVRPRLVLITSFLANGDQRVSVRWRHESD